MGGALDARGNGQYLAEKARQRWGEIIVEVMLSAKWYAINMPPYIEAFGDKTVLWPYDADILADHQALAYVNGVIKVPDEHSSKGADGYDRHGDTAPAGALGYFASRQDFTEYGYTPAAAAPTKYDETNAAMTRDGFACRRFVVGVEVGDNAATRPIWAADPQSAMKTEQAAPTLGGVRRPEGNHQAPGLTPPKLARILREAIDGDPERYLELAEDMEERNEHYAGVLGVRKRQVSGLEITVEAASDAADDVRAADLVREVIGRDDFEDELFDILDAIGKGFSATEIIWDTSEGQWLPSALKWRDPRWFTFDPADRDTLRLRGAAGDEDLWPAKWIVHRAKVKSGLTIRGGIARSAAWAYLFKTFTASEWAIFCEAYGQPLRLGKFGPGASEEDKKSCFRRYPASPRTMQLSCGQHDGGIR